MNRGDVVDLDWPFSDRKGSKVRPAVVVQADFLNGVIDDTILVQITSSQFGLPGTEVELDPADEPVAGLTKICYANCMNLLTLDQTLIIRRVGNLSDVAMRQIEECLKIVLAIP
jgi:mRNA interferase MazF